MAQPSWPMPATGTRDQRHATPSLAASRCALSWKKCARAKRVGPCASASGLRGRFSSVVEMSWSPAKIVIG